MNDSKQSLLDLFTPPDDTLKGQTGLLCGYSATEDFLEIAMENFTQMSSVQRSSLGMLNLILYLDKRKKQITSVPGIYHALFDGDEKAFSLMHAKVGILTFAKDKYSRIDALRIFVTTGNWTRTGMIENLDLIWKLDVNFKEEAPDRESLIEVTKVFLFFKTLNTHYPLIHKCSEIYATIEKLLPNDITEKELESSQFFSTFDEINKKKASILDCVKLRFERNIGGKPYNMLYCGSGFFEDLPVNSENNDNYLKVFQEIEANIFKPPLFVKSSINGYIISNPHDLFKFNSLIGKTNPIEWKIRKFKDRAKIGEQQKRKFLHAKYIFCGYRHGDRFTSAKLYLGSGNLSKKGFLYNLNNPEGNIEAGVVIDASDRTEVELDIILCISDEDCEPTEIENTIDENTEPFTNEETIFAPPIRAIVDFDLNTKKGVIEWGTNPKDCYFFNPTDNQRITIQQNQERIELPISIEVKSHLTFFIESSESSFSIPIITKDGEYGLIPPERINTESALSMLLSYPEISYDEEENDSEENFSTHRSNLKEFEVASTSTKRVLSTAMELVENIARKNQVTPNELMNGWIDALVFTLIRCLSDAEKSRFKNVGINFLAVLKQQHFSPNFEQLKSTSDLVQKYNDSIDKIMCDWNLQDYPVLGAKQNEQ